MRRLAVRFNFPLFIAGVCLAAFCASCSCKKDNTSAAEQFSRYSEKAGSLMPENPKAAISLLDSVYSFFAGDALPDSLVTDYLNLKTNALLQLDRKDSAIQFMHMFIITSPDEQNKNSKIHAMLWLARYSINDGKYTDARKHLDEAFSKMANDTGSFELARALNLEGGLLSRTGDYVGAQKKLLAAISIFENLNNSRALGPVYSGLANNYQSLGENELALIYFRKALMITEFNKDSLNWCNALNSLGNLYQNTNPDSARYYFFKARDLMRLKPWSGEALTVQYNIAMFYYNRKEYQKALDIYNEILSLCEKYNIKGGIYRAMSGLGNVYEAQSRDREALQIFHDAAKLADNAGEKPVQVQLLEGEKYMLEKAGNYKEAFILQKAIKHLSDSLFALDKQIAVHDLELAYNNEKTERKNEALNAKMLLINGRMRASLIILGLVLISAIALGILLFHMYKLYRQRDEAYNTLFEKYRNDMQAKGAETDAAAVSELVPHIKAPNGDENYRKVVEYFESAKPYLNPDLHFEDLTLQLRMNRRILFQAIQDNAGMNFKTFINSYRIKEALRLLAEPDKQNYKIEAIAREAGFGSKASFYATFSQITGSRPSEFR